MPKILILFAHPALEKSRLHAQLLQEVKNIPGITLQDLYEAYPDFDVDVAREQALLLQHDIIFLQHPFYWYSAPALVKQWEDLVLEHGWAYGKTGKALQGKRMGNIISAGGKESSYQPEGHHRHTMQQFLLPFSQTAALCNMEYLPPFVIHGAHLLDEYGIHQYVAAYRQVLERLRDGDYTIQQLLALKDLQELLAHPVQTT
jgi:glutathione-regulated potassium-efflux system ancillary protein KefG